MEYKLILLWSEGLCESLALANLCLFKTFGEGFFAFRAAYIGEKLFWAEKLSVKSMTYVRKL